MILIGTIDEFSTREIPRRKVRLKTATTLVAEPLNNLPPLTCSWSSYKYNTQPAKRQMQEACTLLNFKSLGNTKSFFQVLMLR